MKRPLAYITAAWCGSDLDNQKLAAQYCRTVYEAMKNDIAVAQRLGITATTLEGILTVKGQGRRYRSSNAFCWKMGRSRNGARGNA